MGELITPDILKEFAVIGEPETIAGQMRARYGDLVDRTSLRTRIFKRQATCDHSRTLRINHLGIQRSNHESRYWYQSRLACHSECREPLNHKDTMACAPPR